MRPDPARALGLFPSLAGDGVAELRAGWRQQVLTLLGIVWGAAAVILLLSIGAGFYSFIDLGFKKTGDRYVAVRGQFTSTEMGGARPGREIQLERADLERLRASVPSARLIGARFSRGGIAARTPLKTRSTVVGAVTPEIRKIQVHRIESGRFIDAEDDHWARRVAVLGANLVPIFFGDGDPLGQTIQVDGHPFIVIGTLRQKGNQLVTNNGLHDDMIFIPMSAGQRVFDVGDRVGTILADPHRVDETEQLKTEMLAVLRKFHRIAPEDDQAIDVYSMQEGQRPMKRLGIGLEILLGFVGTVILAMAGAGVANLMIAVVNQRRVELAMRRACGARRGDLQLQLLVETLVVVLAGGAIGAAIAVGLLTAIAQLPMPPFIPVPRLSPSVVVTTVLVLVGVGVVSGLAPARLASRVDPATAMRVS